MSIVHSFTESLKGSGKKADNLLIIICLALAAIFGLAIAYLSVKGLWEYAFILLFALPAFVFLHRYPFVGLIIWLWLTPFLVVTDGGTLRKVYWLIHRALPFITIAFILFSVRFGFDKKRLPKLGWPELFMLGYIVASELSIVYLSDNVMAQTYRLYDRVVVPMSLYLLVRLAKPNQKDLEKLYPVIVFILVSQSVIGILSWTAPQVLPSGWTERAGLRTTGSLRFPGAYSTTLLFCVSFILHGIFTERLKKGRLGLTILALLGLVMVFLSMSRGSWLSGILVMLGLIYLYPKVMLRVSSLTVPLLLLLVIGGGLLSNQLSWAQARFNSDETALGRLPLMYAAYRMFEAKPIVGWGYGNYDRYDHQFQERVFDLVNPNKDLTSHNAYLTLLSEQGITGTFLFLFPLFWWFAKTLKVLHKMPEEGFWSRKLIIIFWLVIMATIVVNNFADIDVVFNLGLWWVMLALIANMVQEYSEPIKAHPKLASMGLQYKH